MSVAIYCRVSTSDQDDQLQLCELQAFCDRKSWKVFKIYREQVSGLKPIESRRAIQELLIDARRRNIEKVIVWSVDRLARSIEQLTRVLSELQSCQVEIYSYRQGIDTSSPMGSILWQFLGMFAEFEHTIRKERQASGIARAKARGVRFGRPPTSAEKRRKILALRSKGLAINKIAKMLKVGSGTVSETIQNR